MNVKHLMAVTGGVLVGKMVSPFVLNLFRIPVQEGFGMDDVVDALVVGAAVIATLKVLRA